MSRERKIGPVRPCVRCGRKHNRITRMCSDCHNDATRRYRAGDKHARNTTGSHKLGKELSDWKPSKPPPPPPGFDPADLRIGRPE